MGAHEILSSILVNLIKLDARIWKFLECVYGLNGELGKVNSKQVYSWSTQTEQQQELLIG
jgi:hypothetical protein